MTRPTRQVTRARRRAPVRALSWVVVGTAALALSACISDDAGAGTEKYSGTTIEVTGVVEEVDEEYDSDDEHILFITDEARDQIAFVSCTRMSSDAVSGLSSGASVTVAGDFASGDEFAGVILEDCAIR